jgi:hypothetical protein
MPITDTPLAALPVLVIWERSDSNESLTQYILHINKTGLSITNNCICICVVYTHTPFTCI